MGNQYEPTTAPYMPSPEQIEASKNEIRDGWGEDEEQKRAGIGRRVPVDYELAKLTDLGQN